MHSGNYFAGLSCMIPIDYYLNNRIDWSHCLVDKNYYFVVQKLDFYPKDFSPAGGNFFLFY